MKIALIILFFSVLLFSGCATNHMGDWRTYSGPSLPQEREATLFFNYQNVEAIEVEGKEPILSSYISHGYMPGIGNVCFLPGRHTIKFRFWRKNNTFYVGAGYAFYGSDPVDVIWNGSLEGGKTYYALVLSGTPKSGTITDILSGTLTTDEAWIGSTSFLIVAEATPVD